MIIISIICIYLLIGVVITALFVKSMRKYVNSGGSNENVIRTLSRFDNFGWIENITLYMQWPFTVITLIKAVLKVYELKHKN